MISIDYSVARQELNIDEDFRLRPYDDATGKELVSADPELVKEVIAQFPAISKSILRGDLTDGRGHNLTNGHSRDLLETEYDRDYDGVVSQLDGAFNWFGKMNGVRQRAIANVVFNMGLPRFLTFKKAIGHLALGEFEEAAKEFEDSKWYKDKGGAGPREIRVVSQIRMGV